jgi:hypothetical protein
LGFETLSLEKVDFSPCSSRALGLHGFEREEESLMDVHVEQALACLKLEYLIVGCVPIL